jgi:hypothetical protein
MDRSIQDELQKIRDTQDISNPWLEQVLEQFDQLTIHMNIDERRKFLVKIIEHVCGSCCERFKPCHCWDDE